MKITSYPELEKYLYSFILHTSLRLDRIKNLLEKLGNPQDKFQSIVVAGTAGKGSTSTMLASILRENGLKVGLYTSPHLIKLNERFKINNKDISDQELIKFVNNLKKLITDQSYFEILTTLAFLWFSKEKIDVAILEVGMGGQWDATNVVNNKISVLTNVGLDHTEFLGKTVTKIAQEKVAILKKNGVMITGVTQPTVKKIVMDYSKRQQAKVIFVKPNNYQTKLLGEYQKINASLAVAAARQFKPNISVKKGLLKAYIPGRLEVINKKIILDGAHNPIKMKALVESLKKLYPQKKFVTVIAFKKDKDTNTIIRELSPIVSKFFITKFSLHTDFGPYQAADPSEIAKSVNLDYEIIPNPKKALEKALKMTNEMVLVTGSLYLVGEIKKTLLTK